jgi:hypothetical protein
MADAAVRYSPCLEAFMTRRTNSRIAGIALLLYIGVGIPVLILMGRARHGEGVAARLASIAAHAGDVHLALVFELIESFCALALAVTLYALTRDQDRDLALLGMLCRVAEGVLGAAALPRSLQLLWLAGASGGNAPDASTTAALGAYLLNGPGWGAGAIFFAVGSTLFSWLMLRGRIIPAALAWLGVLASLAAVIGLPLNAIDALPDSATWFFWIPLALFEVTLALWLMVKGAAPPLAMRTAVAEAQR